MRTTLIIASSLLLFSWLTSCEKSEKSATAWGTFSVAGVSDTQTLSTTQGLTLEEEGSGGTGYCRYRDGKFSFAVGTKSPTNVASTADYYLQINNIEGPPSQDPYNDEGEPRTDENRTFSGGSFYTSMNTRLFDEDDMISDRCIVQLFSEASAGDLTPLEYGKNMFDYLVVIDCTAGLTPLSTTSSPTDINGFTMSLWFENCET